MTTPPFFTWLRNTFYMANKKVLRSLPARNVWAGTVFVKKCVPLQEIWRITIIAWTGGASISDMACQELIMSPSR